MRFLLVLLLVLMLIPVFSACGSYDNITSATTTCEVSMMPTSTEVPTNFFSPTAKPGMEAMDPEIETVVKEYISAQNSHDWNKLTRLWREDAQGFFEEFFSYPANEKNKCGYFAVKNAELLSVVNQFETYNALTGYEIETYKDFCVVNAAVNYHLSNECWGYSEGNNSVELVLVKEDGVWRISQDSLMIDWDLEDDYVYEDHSSHADGAVHFENEITGYYLVTEWGDYAHIIIMTIDGKQKELWATVSIETEMLPFLQKMQITWTNRDHYIDEAEKVENQDAATDIQLID